MADPEAIAKAVAIVKERDPQSAELLDKLMSKPKFVSALAEALDEIAAESTNEVKPE